MEVIGRRKRLRITPHAGRPTYHVRRATIGLALIHHRSSGNGMRPHYLLHPGRDLFKRLFELGSQHIMAQKSAGEYVTVFLDLLLHPGFGFF